ncbi:eukaryotic translation initiation factor 4E-1 [Pyrus x bretschneideri]|uniref:eukaryotic translation initiation factor 4E-1 n=1 Tax=Pyrus x bretschneideri TaxID=225117 RepID=UPI00051102B4|nr:eukaryotic translation initiation factor 4E-1 [Pyrus x bretschneideri]
MQTVTMVVEDAPKTSASEDQAKTEAHLMPRAEDDDETEEGEIVGDQDSASSKPSKGIAPQSHPLEHSWTFWFDNPAAKSAKLKQADWGSTIRPIYTFSTVEEFWSIYNNIRRPSNLNMGTDFHCFKYKIEPKWEDPVCANGGKWTVTYPKGKSDTPWLYTLLAMIGEQFDHGDEICGAVVNVRTRQEKIALWTKNAANEAAQLSIGKQWKGFLDCNETIGFIFHEDAMRQERAAKNKYVA